MYELNLKYVEQVYAGVLGKIIGVYLGRPFEGWTNERIEKELGEITYYVHEKFGYPLIVTDDDISGTFNFIRALPENGNSANLSAAQIGDWWLNSIIENRTILWWGGIGISTEHTAYLRLLAGHKAPESGSIALNGVAVAEEIGAQIFIDGWGLICPNDPERAVDFARRAGSVSHDGEAIFGAQILAALISLSFTETNFRVMLRTAQELIPSSSMISETIDYLLEWSAKNGDDWRATLKGIHGIYPYERFGTNCPMVSNHAVVLMALLHGDGDFSKSLMIANTAGYDTDCNSGNVGCILGVMNGLSGMALDKDWRGPVADRLIIAAADGGRAITDAVRETYEIINSARALKGLEPFRPKDGARFHFSLPDSVQGFLPDPPPGDDSKAVVVGNEGGCLSIILQLLEGQSARAATATFTPQSSINDTGYSVAASPTLYSGQVVSASVTAAGDITASIEVALCINVCAEDGVFTEYSGDAVTLRAGESSTLSFRVPDTAGAPIADVGVQVANRTSGKTVDGTVKLDWLTWSGCPEILLRKPDAVGTTWLKAWVSSVDNFAENHLYPLELTYRAVKNKGTGLVAHGTREWRDYTVSARVMPHLATRVGLAAAVQGLRRYIAIMLDSDKRIKLVKQYDDQYTILAESDKTWRFRELVELSLAVSGDQIIGRVGDTLLKYELQGADLSGAIAMIVDEGHCAFGDIIVRPS